MTAPHGPGPLATEAGLLLDVLTERLSRVQQTARPTAPEGRDGSSAADEHAAGEGTVGDGTVGSVCTTGCPFCQVLAVVRGERPETAARLVDGALVVVRGLRALLDHAPDGRMPASTPGEHSPGHHRPADSPPGDHSPDGQSPDERRPHHRTPDDARRTPGTGTSGGPAAAHPAADRRPAGSAPTGNGSASQARVEWIDVR